MKKALLISIFLVLCSCAKKESTEISQDSLPIDTAIVDTVKVDSIQK